MDWNRAASVYNLQLPLERAALAMAIGLAQPHRDDVWLDVGTGTGGLMRQLADGPDRPGQVVAIDRSAAMLHRAGALPARWALGLADARRLPFADRTFTVVTAAYLLHVVDVATRAQIIGECHRVLRAAGRLVVITPAWPRGRVARMVYAPLAACTRSAVGPRAGLRPLDPSTDLEHASFRVAATRYVGRGYPSLCVSATR